MMDPNEALAEIREICIGNPASIDGDRLAELIQGLDGWITNGGFLPTDWQGSR